MPCAVEYELTNADTASNLPELANNFTQNEASLLKALDDAMNTVSTDAIRFATHKIQLRGQKGEIVATDGRQLLWQSGYQFPWTDDLLVPRIKAFACSELANAESVAIGKTAKHVCIRVRRLDVLSAHRQGRPLSQGRQRDSQQGQHHDAPSTRRQGCDLPGQDAAETAR